jgi:hypothetical protein
MPIIVLTSGTQWFVPPDCQTATIEAIGAGVGATLNSHGGSYAKSTGVTLTPGSYVNINIPAGAAGGTTWLNKANQPKYTPAKVYWSGTQFVALDPTNNIITSPDAVAWTQKPGALTYLGISAGGGASPPVVTANNDLIFAASYDQPSGSIKSTYSINGGTTWNAGTTFSSNFVVTGLSFLNGAFVIIVRTNTSGVYTQYTSSDAITWTQTQTYTEPSGTSPFVYFPGINRSIFANSLYANVGQTRISGSLAELVGSSSTLGGIQTLSNPTGGSLPINGIAYGNGLWVITTSDGFCNNGAIYTATSPTGPWTLRTSGTSNYISSIVFDGTKFIVSEAKRVLTSTNGITWTIYNLPFNNSSFQSTPNLVVSGSATYACSSNEGIAKTTDNGTTWTKILSGTGAPVVSTNGVTAAGGAITPTSQQANSVFTAEAGNFFQGGTSGNGDTGCCGIIIVSAGGGGAGPDGKGGNGGNYAAVGAGGGGAANYGTANTNGNGQNGSNAPFKAGDGGISRTGNPGGVGFVFNGTPQSGGSGTNGSGGGGATADGVGSAGNGGAGSVEPVWTDFSGATHGPGSGGGGSYYTLSNAGLAGGPGGGGRGTFGQGIIVITYTSAPVSGRYIQVLTSSQTVYVSPGTTTIDSEAIGPGSNGGVGNQNGGGGGAYAKSSAITGFTLGGPAFANVPAASAYGSTANSWFNFVSNSQPISSSQGVLAIGANSATGGGAGSLGSIVAYNGGNGGNSVPGTRQKGGGGGAAAGPLGIGFSGGNGRNNSGTGGGGGGGGTSGSPAAAGVIGGTSNGGAGGQSSGVPSPVPPGPAVSSAVGGAGGTTSANAGNGTNGSGGGGGGPAAPATGFGRGGNGSTLPYWTLGGVVYGPGSGGGGGGQGGTTTLINPGGNAGTYGGGGGATGQFPSATTGGGLGGQGLVVLTYTVVASGTTFTGTVSETATGTDTISAAFGSSVYAVTITETATGTDAVSGGGTFFTSIIESVTATDSFAVIIRLDAATAETATATDIAEAVVLTIVTASVNEQVSAVDVVVVAPSTLNVSVAEVATALESLASGDTYNVQFVDSTTATDTAQRVVLFVGAIVEQAAASDVAEAIVAFTTRVLETTAATDVTLVAPSTSVARVSEAIVALDSLGTQVSFDAQFADLATVFDAVSNANLWNLIDDSQTANWQNVANTQTPTWTDVTTGPNPGWTDVNQ